MSWRKTCETQYIESVVRHLCRTYRGRSAGSASERDCQADLARQLSPWSDHVHMEPFSLHPKAFLGWITMCGWLCVTSVALFWLRQPWLAALVSWLAVALLVFEFIFYRKFVDWLFPKATSYNVYAVRRPQGEVKRRIIFGGHADAAFELFQCYGKFRKLVYPILGCLVGALLLTLLSTTAMAVAQPGEMTGVWLVLAWLQTACLPLFGSLWWFVRWNCVVDGANDNLSGCVAAMGVLRRLALEDQRFDHTEVCCLITGAEEAGLRGALAFAKRHQQTLQQVETVFIAMDTLREMSQLMVYPVGQNGTQKNDPRVCALLTSAAEACGVLLPPAPIYPGAVDSEAFSRHQIPAAGLCGVDHKLQTYYHTRHDTWDNIDADCIRTVTEICLEAARQYDRNGSLDAFLA